MVINLWSSNHGNKRNCEIKISEVETLISSDRIDEAYGLYKTSKIPNHHFYESLIKQGKYSQLTEYGNPSKDELVDYLLKRCDYFAKLQKHEETLKLCEVIFKLDKDNEIGLGHKTYALMCSDKYEDALKCCNHAIELYPNNWRFYMFKSDISCFGFDDYEESSIYLEKWQEIKANH